jgi:hypothetical protein
LDLLHCPQSRRKRIEHRIASTQLFNSVSESSRKFPNNLWDRSTYPTAKTPGRDNRELATGDQETKKPLESQGNQGFSPIGPAGFEPTTSTTPTKRTTPSGPTKTKGKRNTQGNGCTNGCTCDRCLLELADALKGQLSIDERRKLAVLLLQ